MSFDPSNRFDRRSHEPERLDTGDYTAKEYKRWLLELSLINRVFGEVRALRNSLRTEIDRSGLVRVSALDVGAGSGTLIRSLRRWLGGRGGLLAGAEIDVNAARLLGKDDSNGKISSVCCDGLRLPFADGSFDFVFCSLVLHHLDDGDARTLLGEMSRVARRRIFVIDLDRSRNAYYLFKLASRFLFQRFTREDGALSILRSFNGAELEQLAAEAGLLDVRVNRSAAYRLVLSGI